jgi:uncharacterized protein YkwD
MIPWLWVLVSASVAGALTWWVCSEIGKRKFLEAVETLDQLLSVVADLKSQVNQFGKRAEKAEALVKVPLEANASFEKQRDDAWARYHAAGIGAGNAQAMLLRSLEGAVRELNKYREKDGLEPVQVNDGLREIVAEFKREHGTP